MTTKIKNPAPTRFERFCRAVLWSSLAAAAGRAAWQVAEWWVS